MKKYLLAAVFILSNLCSYSQLFDGEIEYQNAFKVNLSSLAFRNISVQYEHQIGPRMSFAVSFRELPHGQLPFYQTVSKIINNPFIQFDKMNVGAFGLIPELRFYLGQRAMKGFYIAPFANYSMYKNDLPVPYNGKTGFFTGTVETITGGIQFGSQFRLSDRFYLDWWILGPNYGGSSGNLVFVGALTNNEQSAMNFEMERIKNDAPLHFIESYKVTNTGATIVIKGPWAGVRGMGICVSFQF
jgi:hypothetical protein